MGGAVRMSIAEPEKGDKRFLARARNCVSSLVNTSTPSVLPISQA